MKRPWLVESATQKRIRELESELYETRKDIVELMPVDVSRSLQSYGQCRSFSDFSIWRQAIADDIASRARLLPNNAFSRPRALCPLCKSDSLVPYEQGYAVPDGLTRHLLGRGNAQQCVVTRAAFRLATTALQKTFVKADEEAKQKLEERRKTEQLYLIDPQSPPELLTERFWGEPRTLGELQWAEDRLVRLGFTITNNNNVRSYQLSWQECVVFADPREKRRIDFVMLKEDARKTKRVRYKRSRHFNLPDGWKNNLNEKLNRLLSAAHRQLTE